MRRGGRVRLKGARALVTGGTRGIGLATAEAMGREGASVFVASRKEAGVQAALEHLRAAVPDGAFDGAVLHVGQLDSLQPFIDTHGPFDVLVNNAGTNPFFGPMLQTSRGAWEKTFDVNLKGPFELTRCVVQAAIDRDETESVRIINVSSILGAGASPLQGAYGMTKAALISMTQTLAFELGEAGIRVNAIAPGIIETKLSAAITSSPALLERVTARTANKRVGRPEEVAGLVVFLASDESRYVTGQTLFVDGGYSVG